MAIQKVTRSNGGKQFRCISIYMKSFSEEVQRKLEEGKVLILIYLYTYYNCVIISVVTSWGRSAVPRIGMTHNGVVSDA